MSDKEEKIRKEVKNKNILITGGAGSIGFALTKKLLNYPVKSIRVLDTNEYSLFKLKRSIDDTRIRILLGSVLDKERLEIAVNNIDIIIHAAAVKNIEITEYNPMETIEINVVGIMNLIKMCMREKPKKMLNISTDKAADPTTLYGTTKSLGEKLTTWAGQYIVNTKFASIRFGNVMETKGNVFELWNEQKKQNSPLSITHLEMKRYYFNIEQATDFILSCLPMINEGEIFVPKMKLYNMLELAKKISKKHKIIGKREGEKMLEILITKDEIERSKKMKDMWMIRPSKTQSSSEINFK